MKKIEFKNTFFCLFDGMYSTKKFAVPEVQNNFENSKIPDIGFQKNWAPIIFKKLKEEGPLPDYVCTDICGRICSPKLRKYYSAAFKRRR